MLFAEFRLGFIARVFRVSCSWDYWMRINRFDEEKKKKNLMNNVESYREIIYTRNTINLYLR